MKASNEPMQQMMNVKSIKAFIADIKAQINDMTSSDPDYDPKSDILMAAITNLEEELQGVKEISDLPARKQARIVADFAFVMSAISEDEDYDDDDEYETEEEDEDEYDTTEEEDEEDDK